jgi:hypothetical protein
MEDVNWSILSTQYLPLLCPIPSIPGWHLKSSIKVMYFVTKINIELILDCINYSLFQSVSKSLCIPRYRCLLLRPSLLLFPVQFTQSSLQTTTTPIVYSIYAVKSSALCLHLFLILPHPELQSLTSTTPQVHQQHQMFIPLSPIAPPPLVSATCSPSLEVELAETLQRSLEMIPIVPEAHSVSFRSASLIRYSYYICKGTSVCFLTSPILSHSPPVHMYSLYSPLYHFQGPYL